jgi:hypothetical protein
LLPLVVLRAYGACACGVARQPSRSKARRSSSVKIDQFSSSERIDITRKNELLWSAWYHNCWRHTNNRHNYPFQPIAARLQRRRSNMRMTVLGPAFGPSFLNFLKAFRGRLLQNANVIKRLKSFNAPNVERFSD